MTHIHTKPGQHDFTASAYIIRLEKTVPKLVLHMHKRLGVLMQFGGHVELDETPWQAVIHETKEESGYDINQLKLLQPKQRVGKLSRVVLHPLPIAVLTHRFSEEHFHTDMPYAFWTDQMPRYQIATGESQDIRSFSREELLAIPKGKVMENVREIGLFIFDHCLNEWEKVSPDQFAS